MKKTSNQKKHYLFYIAIFGSLIIAISGLFSPIPNIIIPIGLILGFVTFYVLYSIPAKNGLWADLRLIAVIFSQSAIGSGLLFFGCIFLDRNICSENLLKAQVFGNFIFPFIMVAFLWLTQRLPAILGKR